VEKRKIRNKNWKRRERERKKEISGLLFISWVFPYSSFVRSKLERSWWIKRAKWMNKRRSG
jgi:hypothetical protein